jgi:dephospho-CoA kinase
MRRLTVRSVALIGPQGSGKTTLADNLVEFRGYQRHGIADAVKEVTRLAYPTLTKQEQMTVARYSGEKLLTGREVFQDVGAALREVDNDFWLRVWRRDYFDLVRLGYPVVIDDVRLPREATYLKAVSPDIVLVRVHASAEARGARLGTLVGSHDITEQGWQSTPFDYEIDTTDKDAQHAFRILVDLIGEASL